MAGGAVISADGRYRYVLTRDLGPPELRNTRVLWVMLNPSTADALVDDPTIRRCISFSTVWGYHTMSVINLFAYRATDPKELMGLSVEEARGPDNWLYWQTEAARARLIVAAWGATKVNLPILNIKRAAPGKKIVCLGRTQDGSPRHPLYVKADTKMEDYL